MGEYADMIIDGTVCEGCGELIDGESPGFPRHCSQACDPYGDEKPISKQKSSKKVKKHAN